MSDAKLLPCPFCGNKPRVSFSHEAGRYDVYEVECDHCIIGLYGPLGFKSDKAEAAAVAKWNTRPTERNDHASE